MSFLQTNNSEKSSVQVAVRVRPLNAREADTDIITSAKDATLYIKNPEDNKKKTFTYDYVYNTNSTQSDVFNNIGTNIIDHAFKGYNACIFAYGQTGCFGKGTPIMMFDGNVKNVEDIKLGDIVMGDDDTPRNVIHLFHNREHMFDVIDLDDKLPSYSVNMSHIMIVADISEFDHLPSTIFYSNIYELSVRDIDIRYIHTGVYKKGNDYIPYRIKFIEKGVNDYYGFMLDKNHRFQHASGIILRNSGKTHTMMGTGRDLGLIPKICDSLFFKQDEMSHMNNTTISYKIELSYLEIYSEEVRDLLAKNNPPGGLKVRQHPELGPYVEGLSQILVENPKTARKLIDQGNKERITAATLMNSRSSRSHAILTLYFTQIITDPSIGRSREIVSKINLVDLAGSEKIEMSGVTGINFKEAININKSLSTLGLVIGKLALLSTSKKPQLIKQLSGSNVFSSVSNATEIHPNIFSKLNTKVSPRLNLSPRINISPHKHSPVKSKGVSITDHVPFRDSVLTWILKESLGGNSKTYMVATISPSAINYNESLSTLRYASNAKQIINNVKVNEDPNDKLIRILTSEVETLKKQLLLKGSDSSTSGEELRYIHEELAQREELLREKDKSWEQKLEESKRLSNEAQEQLKQELSIKQQEYKKKLDNMDDERSKLLQEMELLKASMTDNAISQKTFEEELAKQQIELAKKQAEFEKERIVDTAVSLQEYYEQKLLKLKQDYESKIAERNNIENKQMLNEIQELRIVNLKLKEELSKSQNILQVQIKQFSSERTMLSRQIQQLHSKIHSLEQDISQRKLLSPIRNNDTNLNHVLTKMELDKLENKHSIILSDINRSRAELEALKNEHNNLLEQKMILREEIKKIKSDLDEQIDVAKNKLQNPTSEELLQIKIGFDKIFENLNRI